MSVQDPLTVPSELASHVSGITDRLHTEFAGIFSPETIKRSVMDSYERFAESRVLTFVPVFLERFTRERLSAIARTQGKIPADRPLVVFLCVQNAGRSQIAAGWAQHLGGDALEIFSGGSDPWSQVNPSAIRAMAEVGIDIADAYPKPWTEEIIESADVIVTMGCGDACPVLPGKRYIDWKIPDPAGLTLEEVRPIRDELGERVHALLTELGIATD